MELELEKWEYMFFICLFIGTVAFSSETLAKDIFNILGKF